MIISDWNAIPAAVLLVGLHPSAFYSPPQFVFKYFNCLDWRQVQTLETLETSRTIQITFYKFLQFSVESLQLRPL